MDYPTLIANKATPGSIRQWANNDALPSAEIVTDAEGWLYERLRVWEMIETNTDLVFTVGSNTIALPTGFLGMREFWIVGEEKSELNLVTPHEVLARRAYEQGGAIAQTKPNFYYWDKANFVFDQRSDVAYQTMLVTWMRPPALTVDAPTNWVTEKYPRLMRLATRGIAFEWLKDGASLARDELMKTQDHIDVINAQSSMAMQNMSAAVMRS